jgi:hypothetical protein
MALVWKVWVLSLLSLAGGVFLTAGLSERNPFVWPGFEPPEDRVPPPRAEQPPPSRGEEMEFRAVYELNGVTRALIRNRTDQSYEWITIGEEGESGVLVKAYNREQNQIHLSSSAGQRWLNLQGASGSPRPSRPDANRTRGEEIEFHAVYEIDGVTRALIRNRVDQTFHWVTVGGDGREGFTVRAHNREHNRILLSTADGERWLDLQRSAVASAPAAQPPPTPGVHRPAPSRPTPAQATPAGQRPPTVRAPAPTPPRVSTTASRTPAVQTPSDGSVRSPAANPRTRVPPTLRSRGPSGPNPGLAPPNYTPPPVGMEPPPEGPPSTKPILRGR